MKLVISPDKVLEIVIKSLEVEGFLLELSGETSRFVTSLLSDGTTLFDGIEVAIRGINY